MHITRAMLDAEALVLGYIGVLSVGVPQAVIRLVSGGEPMAGLELVVPWTGALLVMLAIVQVRVQATGDASMRRVVLQARLVGDVLVCAIALLHSEVLTGMAPIVRLETVSLAILFAAIRFYALVLLSEAGAEQTSGLGAVTAPAPAS
jgi:hypothetical protein